MKGCYCLIINLEKSAQIKIGKLGNLEFEKGHYVYVGSAMNSLESRIKRHLSNNKKLHWHVDYLLTESKITDVIYAQSNKNIECKLSQFLSAKTNGIKNFGCSDCECESHLYYFKNENNAIEYVKQAYNSIAIDYEFFKI